MSWQTENPASIPAPAQRGLRATLATPPVDARLIDGTASDQAPALLGALQYAKSIGSYVQLPATTVGFRLNSPISWEEGFRLDGTVGDRAAQGGTVVLCYGAGGIINGSDDGQAWNAANYNGPQGVRVSNVLFKHNDPDTPLNNGQQSYGAGSYGIRDWRGGGIILKNVVFENFEFGTWGVQSDLNVFENVRRVYCHVGSYLGPRSDQHTEMHPEFLLCDTALDNDQAKSTRLFGGQVIGCGAAGVSPIIVRKGSKGVCIYGPWFEFYQGYNGEIKSFVSVGEVAGYDAALTTADCAITDPTAWTSGQGSARHVRFIASGDDCIIHLRNPQGDLGQFEKMFGSYGDISGYYRLDAAGGALTNARIITKVGTANPNPLFDLNYGSSRAISSVNGRFEFLTDQLSANWRENSVRMNLGAASRVLAFDWVNSASGGLTERLRFEKRYRPGTAAPTAGGPYDVGDQVYNTAPAAGGFVGWVCIAAGSPGTWKGYGLIEA